MGRQSCEAGVRFLVAGPCVPCWSRGSRGPRNTACLFKRHARSQRTPGGAAAPRPCERLTVHPDPPPHLGAWAGPGGQRWPLLPALSSPGLRGEMEVFEELRVHSRGGRGCPVSTQCPLAWAPTLPILVRFPGCQQGVSQGQELLHLGVPWAVDKGRLLPFARPFSAANHSQGEKRILTS